MEERITGVMIYYYFVCKRKLWYFCHDLQMENVSQNENVQLGKLLDETSYRRNQKHINIDDTINIDISKAQIDYPLLKKNIEVSLSEEDEKQMKNIIDHIIQIRKQAIPELDDSKKICKKCAYYDICFI